MKKAIKLFGIIALVAVIGFTIIACNKGGGGGSSGGGGKLSGAYKFDDFDMSYTFTGNKVTITSDGEVISEVMFSTSGNEFTMYYEEDGERVEFQKFIYSLEGDKLMLYHPDHLEQPSQVMTKK